MNVCIDQTDEIQRNRSSIGNLPLTSSTEDGLIRNRNIDQLITNFQKNIVSSGGVGSVALLTTEYGQEPFNQSVIDLNVAVAQIKRDNPSLLNQYPALQNRVLRGTSLTSIEVAEFTITNLLSPQILSANLAANPSTTLQQLNNFYNESFTESGIGAFCALAPSIFGAVEGFFDSLSDIASKITNLISKIENFDAAILLETLTSKIKDVVDNVIEKVKGIVDNFNISTALSSTETFVSESVVGVGQKIKEQAQSFFNEENIKKFKEKIDGLISYAVNTFENPSLDEIRFLIARFCNFVGQVENLLNQVKAPLDNFTNNIRSSRQTIKANSQVNTVRAVSSGALRFDDGTRKTNIDSMQGNTRAPGTSNPAPIEVADVDGVTSWNNGRGDSKIKFGPGLQAGKMGEEGWTRVDTTARVYLTRVQQRFGRQLQVNSGYRSPAYNQSVGGASKSKHMSGTALDISWNGMTTQNREEFINIAYEEGFLGIGRYGTRFVHIDLGPQRSWSG